MPPAKRSRVSGKPAGVAAVVRGLPASDSASRRELAVLLGSAAAVSGVEAAVGCTKRGLWETSLPTTTRWPPSASAAAERHPVSPIKSCQDTCVLHPLRPMCRRGAGPCEAQVYQFLRRLPASRRRQVLARHLSQAQRQVLELWILARHRRDQRCRRLSSLRVGRPRGSSYASAGVASGKRSTVSDLIGRVVVARPAAAAVYVQRHCRHGRISFRACVTIGPLRLQGPYAACRAEAERQAAALVRVRERLARLAAGTVASVGHRSHEAVSLAPATRGSDCWGATWARRLWALLDQERSSTLAHRGGIGNVRLSGHGVVAARAILGVSLGTPSFRLTSLERLEAALVAWHRLQVALDELAKWPGDAGRGPQLSRTGPQDAGFGWHQFREAYAEVWANAGRSARSLAVRMAVMDARFDAKAAARAVSSAAPSCGYGTGNVASEAQQAATARLRILCPRRGRDAVAGGTTR